MNEVDLIQLRFSADSLLLLNIVLGLVMFGVALDLKLDDFLRLLREPRGPLVGLAAQFVVLPWLTLLLTLIIKPQPSIALGMLLVASCPGGNMSNFFTHLAGGRTELSVTMTAISTVAALFMTPFNITTLGSVNPATAALITTVSLDGVQMLYTVALILGLPLVAGMLLAARAPRVAGWLRKPLKIFSIVAFAAFVVIALIKNFDYFLQVIAIVAPLVALHNAVALSTGYCASSALRLPYRDRRAITIEVGIQNSALGLVLIFQFFNGLGGMAIIAAWWGLWHIVAGFCLAWFWSRRQAPAPPAD